MALNVQAEIEEETLQAFPFVGKHPERKFLVLFYNRYEGIVLTKPEGEYSHPQIGEIYDGVSDPFIRFTGSITWRVV